MKQHKLFLLGTLLTASLTGCDVTPEITTIMPPNVHYEAIETMYDFEHIQDHPEKNYRLEADLDFSNYTYTPPVLYGNFDGNGHTISNLHLDMNEQDGYLMFKTIGREGSKGSLYIGNFSIVDSSITTHEMYVYDDPFYYNKSFNSSIITSKLLQHVTFSDIRIENCESKGEAGIATGICGEVPYGAVFNNIYVDFTANSKYNSAGLFFRETAPTDDTLVEPVKINNVKVNINSNDGGLCYGLFYSAYAKEIKNCKVNISGDTIPAACGLGCRNVNLFNLDVDHKSKFKEPELRESLIENCFITVQTTFSSEFAGLFGTNELLDLNIKNVGAIFYGEGNKKSLVSNLIGPVNIENSYLSIPNKSDNLSCLYHTALIFSEPLFVYENEKKDYFIKTYTSTMKNCALDFDITQKPVDNEIPQLLIWTREGKTSIYVPEIYQDLIFPKQKTNIKNSYYSYKDKVCKDGKNIQPGTFNSEFAKNKLRFSDKIWDLTGRYPILKDVE